MAHSKEYGRQASAKFRAKHPERVAETLRKWYEKNKEKQLNYERKRRGIPIPDRPAPDACELCFRTPPPPRKLVVDHCHQSGAFRGWICATCNSGLGLLGDDEQIVRLALEYLIKHKKGVK